MSFPRPGTQHLHSCVRHHHGLLKLGGEAAVLRYQNVAETERDREVSDVSPE